MSAPAPLRLFLVGPPNDYRVGYDEFLGFVVAARDAEDAVALVSERHGHDIGGTLPWIDLMVVHHIGDAAYDVARDVVLESFNAG